MLRKSQKQKVNEKYEDINERIHLGKKMRIQKHQLGILIQKMLKHFRSQVMRKIQLQPQSLSIKNQSTLPQNQLGKKNMK
jgi:hypothetical protein